MLTKVALTLAFTAVTFMYANPPSRIEAIFDSTGQFLTVRADHPTRDMNKHYIKLIVIKLNGKEIINQSMMSQANAEHQDAVYKIVDAKSGDKIEAEATCNIFGSKSITIVAPGKK